MLPNMETCENEWSNEWWKMKGRGYRIAPVDSIHITKSINYIHFVRCWGAFDVDTFKRTARAQSIHREVYGLVFI